MTRPAPEPVPPTSADARGATAVPSRRTVLSVETLPVQRHGDRLVTHDASLGALGEDLDPFLMVSLYEMRGPTFPPHPHAGFMVATYILPESEIGFINQDSMGTHNRIAPGALHVTVAGRGVLHEEQPELDGGLAQGFQIWIDLPEAQRESAPQALHLGTADVPMLRTADAEVRVLLGAMDAARSPLVLPSALGLFDVRLAPQAGWQLDVQPGDHAFAFVLGGQVEADGHTARRGQLLRTGADGGRLTLAAGPGGARFTVFVGTPLRQQRVARGPFVASGPDQLARFVHDHATGRFGSLRPFALSGGPVAQGSRSAT